MGRHARKNINNAPSCSLSLLVCTRPSCSRSASQAREILSLLRGEARRDYPCPCAAQARDQVFLVQNRLWPFGFMRSWYSRRVVFVLDAFDRWPGLISARDRHG